MSDEPTACVWRDLHDDGWETACGQVFVIIEGTPAENEMKFCCYCGRPLIVELQN